MSTMRGLWSDPAFVERIQKAESADEAVPADEKPATGDKRKTPKLTLTEDDLAKIPHREPAKEVSRAEVKQALTKFLESLAKSQKNNKDQDVKSTDKVWQAEMTLHFNLSDAIAPYTPKSGDGRLYQPADLAGKIAERLPDTIPLANFDKFKKLTAVDTVLPPDTITGQLHKKYQETRDKIAGKFPEKVRKYVKSAIDMVVEKGASYVLDNGIKELGVPSDMQDEVKKAVEDYVKKITDDKSSEDE